MCSLLHGFKCIMVSVILGGTLELDLSLHRPPRLSPADQRRTSSTTQLEELEVHDTYIPQYSMGPAHVQ